MNAFDKDFIKTHYPDLLKENITSSKISMGMTKFVEDKRTQDPNHGRIRGVTKTEDALLPKKFAVYNGAGMPK